MSTRGVEEPGVATGHQALEECLALLHQESVGSADGVRFAGARIARGGGGGKGPRRGRSADGELFLEDPLLQQPELLERSSQPLPQLLPVFFRHLQQTCASILLLQTRGFLAVYKTGAMLVQDTDSIRLTTTDSNAFNDK